LNVVNLYKHERGPPQNGHLKHESLHIEIFENTNDLQHIGDALLEKEFIVMFYLVFSS